MYHYSLLAGPMAHVGYIHRIIIWDTSFILPQNFSPETAIWQSLERFEYIQKANFFKTNMKLKSGFVRVLENLESPGILLWHFPGLESPGKGLLVLESSGNLLNSSKKKKWNVWQTVRRINIKILGVKGLMWILESWKNQSESWKSPGNLFLKKGTNPVFTEIDKFLVYVQSDLNNRWKRNH